MPATTTGTATVQLTINGKSVHAAPGQTVLQAASAAGIDIPTLCDHPALSPVGSCRMCLVEIERQRTLQPACTFPVSEGMVVHTESPKVVTSRKMSLQLLFSERTHYCMFCPVSGPAGSTDCELQALAYRYGMTHWTMPPNYSKRWPVDATREHFVMDHGRCILCRRCVRACDEIAANHTLGVHRRGALSMIGADDGVPFAESTCVECGTCLQLCPTGALVDRLSAFGGRETDVTRTKATCHGCAVGCGIEAVSRDGHLLRIEGDLGAHNRGLLCVEGRFRPLDPTPPRVTEAMVRRNGVLSAVPLDEALEEVARRLTSASSVAGLISPRMTNRLLAGFAWFFAETLQSEDIALFYGDAPPLDLGAAATLEDVADADGVVVIGGDPLQEQKVAGYHVKRAWDRGARLIVVDDHRSDLATLAELHLKLDDLSHSAVSPFQRMRSTYHLRAAGLSQVRSMVAGCRKPVVLYAAGLSATIYAVLRSLPRQTRFMPMVSGSNTLGAHRLGLRCKPVSGEVLYALVGDDCDERVVIPDSPFTVVQSAYLGAATEKADVVLPGRTWAEKPGHLLNMQQQRVASAILTPPPAKVQADLHTLLMLSVRLGRPLSYDQISDVCEAI